MRRPHLVLGSVALLAAVLTGCSSSPGILGAATPTTRASASSTTTASPTTAATPTPTAATPSTPTAALPSTCDALYSPGMLQTLTATLPPLDDPALGDLLSTENVTGLDVLNSGVAALRCTWGAAGSPGLATTAAVVDTASADAIRTDLVSTGFTCDDLAGGTVCTASRQTIDQTDTVRTNGETHWFGGGFWVATHWIDANPDGYTADIAARLTS